MRNMLIDAQSSHLIGHINKHKANVEILLTHPVGIGEHQDIQTASRYAESRRHLSQSDIRKTIR